MKKQALEKGEFIKCLLCAKYCAKSLSWFIFKQLERNVLLLYI